MAEQTDWYERGCSRSCRNKHTLVWGWCELAEKPKPGLNLHVFETFTASDGNTSAKFRQASVEEACAELAKFETEPDWADLGEMARNVGWSPERWVPGQVHWGRRNPNGFIEHRHGWARVRRLRILGHVVIDLYGPAPHEDLSSTARLVDPTPARVLAIARELGIGAS